MAAIVFSVGVGHFIVDWFVKKLRAKLEIGPKARPWTSHITGLLERLFFTILVGVAAPGYPAAMVTWLLVKMSTYWNFSGISQEEGPKRTREMAFTALLGGLASMLFALIGGLCIKAY